MSMNDTLAAALSKINNAEKKEKTVVEIKVYSKILQQILQIMQANQYIGEQNMQENNGENLLTVQLIGKLNKCGPIKPNHSVKINEYEKWEKRYLPAKGFGLLLISTNKGIMTHYEAKEKQLGGRLFAYCY